MNQKAPFIFLAFLIFLQGCGEVPPFKSSEIDSNSNHQKQEIYQEQVTSDFNGERICTQDINEWGHRSGCTCPVNSQYNPRTGNCELNVFDGPRTCTDDINEWGHSSFCTCPINFQYNPQTGSCEVNVFDGPRICTQDVNEWGNPSSCTCPSNSQYNPQTGSCEANVFDRPRIWY